MTNDYGTPAVLRRIDPVSHPAHYTQGRIECIEAIRAATEGKDGYEGVLVGNVLKYLWRFDKKGKPVEDLKKAQRYLQWLIELKEEEELANGGHE